MSIKLRKSSEKPGIGLISTETITTDKYLTNSDAQYQNLTLNSLENKTIYLPDNPYRDKKFSIINQSNSTASFVINGIVILVGDRYEIIFDGNNWVEL